MNAMQTLIADLRYALRGLRRAPLFAMVAIASLALGIGANAAIFTLLDQLLLRQLPIRSADQLVMLYQQGPHMGSNMGARMHSYPLYQDLQQKADAFSEVLCRRVVEASFSVDSQTERLTAELVSGNYFTMLGVRPTIGRVFDSRSDDQVFGGHPVVVLDYRYWTRRFGRDPNVVGRKILVNDHPMTIVGVSEESFTGLDPSSAPEIRVPVLMQREMMPDRSGCTWTTGAHDGCRSSRG